MLNIISKNYFLDIDQFQFQFNQNKTVLGIGSFGIVKLALHRSTNKIYAVKIIDLKQIKNQQELRVIEREIKIHSCLDHPHIIKLWDTLIKDLVIYMIMEFSEKGNLFYYQNLKLKFNEYEAFRFFYQCAKALHYIHQNNFIHRDIKPQNLLLDHHYNIKICDFGWSTENASTRKLTFCGTYEYMAPQMIQKKSYDLKIDIWSLGILLYELLHGRAPFRGQSLQSITKQISNGSYLIDQKLSEQVKQLIKKILQYNPENRPTLEAIFQHSWIKKMQCFIKNKLIKKIEVTEIMDLKLSENKSKQHFHKKSQSDLQKSLKKNKKSSDFNLMNAILLKQKSKKKLNLEKKCKTWTEEYFFKQLNKSKIKNLKQNTNNSPNYCTSNERFITQTYKKQNKIKMLKKHIPLAQTLTKLNNQYLNCQEKRI